MAMKIKQTSRDLIEIRLDSIDNIALISDGHWDHFNIIKYTNRPFSDTESMNKFMTTAWNVSTPKETTVIFLGDFAFCGINRGREHLSKLNGDFKVALKGNHDPSVRHLLKIGFDMASHDRITIETDKHILYCTHRPPKTIPFWIKLKRLLKIGKKVAYIHGHSHNYFPLYRKIGGIPVINVACENICYMPISLKRVIEYIET